MRAIKAFIKGHPVATYFLLAFAISWGGILLVVARRWHRLERVCQLPCWGGSGFPPGSPWLRTPLPPVQ